MFDGLSYEERVAYTRFYSGERPSYSTFIDEETITAGYGKLDGCGCFEYPLIVDQDTLEIIKL